MQTISSLDTNNYQNDIIKILMQVFNEKEVNKKIKLLNKTIESINKKIVNTKNKEKKELEGILGTIYIYKIDIHAYKTRNELLNKNFETAEKEYQFLNTTFQNLKKIEVIKEEEKLYKTIILFEQELEAIYNYIYIKEQDSSKLYAIRNDFVNKLLELIKEYKNLKAIKRIIHCSKILQEYYINIGEFDYGYNYLLNTAEYIIQQSKTIKDEKQKALYISESEGLLGKANFDHANYLLNKGNTIKGLDYFKKSKTHFNNATIGVDAINKIIYDNLVIICDKLIKFISAILNFESDPENVKKEIENFFNTFLDFENMDSQLHEYIKVGNLTFKSISSMLDAFQSIEHTKFESADTFYKKALAFLERADNTVIPTQKLNLNYYKHSLAILFNFERAKKHFEINNFPEAIKILEKIPIQIKEFLDFFNSLPSTSKELWKGMKNYYIGLIPLCDAMIKHIDGFSTILESNELALKNFTIADKKYQEALEIFSKNIDLNDLYQEKLSLDCQKYKQQAYNYKKLIENKIKKEVMLFPNITFNFISNSEYKKQLILDYEELKRCYYSNAFKSVLLLSGSILESCLIDNLKLDEKNYLAKCLKLFPPKKHESAPKKIEKMKLFQMIRVKFDEYPFQEKLADLIRDFRNIIHPDVQIRKKLAYKTNKNDAKALIGYLINLLNKF